MKIDSCKSDSIVEQKSFNIIANDKMFGILSSKIYTDKILAVIRQLSTNAYDAQVLAKNLCKPFQVRLPDMQNRQFYVRDFGHGLSQEQIYKLYTTYGYSDKSESNEYIGCLGLGSKSPFAVVESFVVTSYQNKEKKVYTCFLDNGVPKICKFDECSTEQEDGLKVSFEVERNSVYRFNNKAKQFYSWFIMKPKIFSKIIDTIVDRLTLFRNDVAYFGGIRQISIWMGGVEYQSDYNKILFMATDKKFQNYEVLENISGKFVLKCQIGQFDISVSRQSIQITEQNVKKIIDKLVCFYKKQQQYCSKQMEKRQKLLQKIFFMKEQSCYRTYLLQSYRKLLSKSFYQNLQEDYKPKTIKYYSNMSRGSQVKFIQRDSLKFDLRNYVSCTKDFFVIFDEKLKNRSCYKNFLKYKCGVVIVTDDYKFFDWCKRTGMQVSEPKDFQKHKTIRLPKESCFYKIMDMKDKSVCTTLQYKADKILQKQKIYYVPLQKNEIILDQKERVLFIDKWVNVLCQNFKIQVYGLRKKQFQTFHEDERFIDARELYLKNIKFTDEQQKIRSLIWIPFNGTISKILQNNCVFKTDIMPIVVKKQYEEIRQRIRFQNTIQREKYIQTLNEKQRFCYFYNLYKNTIKCDYTEFYQYVNWKYPVIGMIVRKHTYVDEDWFEILQEYIEKMQAL